ncbi:MAG: hypothetical protein WCI62_05580, partial [Erysipelotrichaceae bacterium]
KALISCLTIGLLLAILTACTPAAKECPICEECKVCEVCKVCKENPFPEGLVLPQVYIMAKLYYTEADLTALQTNVVEPLVAYYETLGQTVVSIQIDNDNRGGSVKNTFTIDVIISNNDGNADPIYHGFLHSKVDGLIPVWVMETMD